MTSQPWSDPEDAVLRERWLILGESASIIGRALGRSRNSVIGRAHRLGLRRDEPSKPTTSAPYPPRRAAVARRTTRTPDGFVYGSSPTAKPQYQERRQPTGEPIDSPNAKVWTERARFECAFIVDGEGADSVSCCNRTDKDSSYCPGHRWVVYQRGTAEPPSKTSSRISQLRWHEGRNRAYLDWAAA